MSTYSAGDLTIVVDDPDSSEKAALKPPSEEINLDEAGEGGEPPRGGEQAAQGRR